MIVKKIAALINIQLLLSLLMLISNTRAKKLCDVRIWYLNIITADVFNADLTDEQMSLKESIEALVMNSADNRDTRMVECNVLYMYNDMLKEQFNYPGTSSGMALKEIDTGDTHDDDEGSTDSQHKQVIEDEPDSIHENLYDTTSSDKDDDIDKEGHGHEHEETLESNQMDSEAQQIEEDDQDHNNSPSLHPSNEDINREDVPAADDMDNPRTVEELEEMYQDSDNINEIDIDQATEDSDADNEYDSTFDYMDDIDDTEIDDNGSAADTDDKVQESTDNVNENLSGDTNKNNNNSSIKRNPIRFGVCWSFGCSSYDILGFNTKESDRTTKKASKYSNYVPIHHQAAKPKHIPSQTSCTLVYFYKLVFLNRLCVSNYSLDNSLQRAELLKSDIDFDYLHDNEKESETNIEDQTTDTKTDTRLKDDIPHHGENNDQVNTVSDKNEGLNIDASKDGYHNIERENTIYKQVHKSLHDNEEFETEESVKHEDTLRQESGSFHEFEKIIEQKTNEYYTKIQSLEVMIMKLENQLLSEALHKQNHSSTITKLENYFLKLENELLKMNKNYQNLREEADHMNQRQNKYLELAYKQQAKMEYPKLPDHTSKSQEIITQHQSKLNELAVVLQNQSKMIMLLHEKYENLEEQNRQLHQMVMNQTIFMTSIIKTVQDLSEQNLQNQKEINALKQQIDIKTSATQSQNLLSNEDVKANVIDELDSMLFHNQKEKVNSIPREQHINEDYTGNTQNADTLLQKYMMKEKSISKLVSDWCPKSMNTCPLCYSYPIVKSNCIPYQLMIWYSKDLSIEQNPSASKLPVPDSAGSHKSNTIKLGSQLENNDEPLSSVQHFANTDDKGTKEQQEGAISTSKSNKEDLVNEIGVEDKNLETDDNQDTEEPHIMENQHIYDDSYQLMGYDKDGKPVWKMKENVATNIEEKSEKENLADGERVQNKENENVSEQTNVQSTKENKAAEEEQTTGEGKDKETKAQELNKEQDEQANDESKSKGDSNKSDENQTNKEQTLDKATVNTSNEQMMVDSKLEDTKDEAKVQPVKQTDDDKTKVIDGSTKPKDNFKELDKTEKTPEKTAESITIPELKENDITKQQSVKSGSDLEQKAKDNTNDTPLNTPKSNTNDLVPHDKDKEKLQNTQTKSEVINNNKDKKDTHKEEKVAKPSVSNKVKEEAELKPKERKVPVNLQDNVAKQNEPRDCYDYYIRGDKRDGIYKVKPVGSDTTIQVFCDMRRGGWTVIQRRQDGTTNFFLEWDNYKKGFGGLYGEHWLGNDNIHLLTNQQYYKLYVDLMDWDKVKKHAEYDYFLVDNEDEGYRIHIDGYNGDAGDGLTKHDGNKFSTKDVDNDKVVKEFGGSCANRFNGAGWYFKCYASNLNGKYYKGGKIPEKKYDGVTWKPWTGPNYSLKKVEMKIRPASAKK